MKQWILMFLLVVYVSVGAQITAMDPSQTYTTGNLVNNTTSPNNVTSTWQNVGLMNQGLPCWAPGDPGCGPQPYFNQGNFNFSYGVTDVYQIANIAAALPNSGTGLRVNGYNFGFTAKNGNGWDGGGLDTLSAYVAFYGSDGKTVRNDYYDLNYVFNWTTFNLNKTFDTPYANKDLSNVRYGFVGGDTSNYWAGPYGPEIININFTLKYSVDACAVNVLSSPSCPGYMDALAKLLPPAVTPSADPVSSSTTTPTSVITTTVTADPIAASVSVVSTSTVAQPAVIGSSTSSQQSRDSTGSGSNAGLAMSIISRNQERDRETLAVAQTAVAAATAAAQTAQQESALVAASAVANSANNDAASNASGGNAGTGIRYVGTNNSASQTSIFQLLSGTNAVSANTPQSHNTTAAALASANVIDTAPMGQPQSLNTTGTGSNTVDNNVAVSSNFLTDRANPINSAIEQRLPMPTASMAATGPTVNTRAADNEAAGSVSIAAMALAPVGYGDYLNFTMRDSAFYAPREVYRNQRNVDNQRVLRQLTNDSRHREMVEQQYRR